MDQERLGVLDQGFGGGITSDRIQEEDHVMEILAHVTHHAREGRPEDILREGKVGVEERWQGVEGRRVGEGGEKDKSRVEWSV